jgi:hypothetical protein
MVILLKAENICKGSGLQRPGVDWAWMFSVKGFVSELKGYFI